MAVVEVTCADGVARVVLDRPPLNVIDLASAGEIAKAIEDAAARVDAGVLVISGRGRAFCAGVDVRDHLPDRGAEMLHAFHRICVALLEAPQPVIAAVHGAALGGGCELTLMCDIVIATDKATFGQPEIRLGVFPPVAAVALPRIVPPHVASELLLTGRIVDAAEAARIGLVNRVVPEAGFDGAVEDAIKGLGTLSPASLRRTKQVIARAGMCTTASEIAEAERFYVEHLLHAPDAIEGLTAFMEKRKPEWGKTGSAR